MADRADFKDSLRDLAATVLNESAPDATAPVEKPTTAPPAPEGSPRRRAKRLSRTAAAAVEPPVLAANVVTLTTRFPKELDDLIETASFGQRMKRLLPGTKQEILIVAAREWLRRNGYLDSDET